MSAAPVQVFEALRAILDVAEADGWSTERLLDVLNRVGRPMEIVDLRAALEEKRALQASIIAEKMAEAKAAARQIARNGS